MKCPLARQRCGGCMDLDKAYGQQLKEKHAFVKRYFPDALPVLGMEAPLHYRNKVISTFANVRSGLISGIYAQGSHFVLPVESCHLHDQRLDEIVRLIRPILSSFGLKAYHEDLGTGTLRHLLLRRALATSQVLVTLVIATPELPHAKEIAEAIRRTCSDVRGIVLNINPRKTSAVLGFQEKVLWGNGFIEDELCSCRFRISSRAFYQVNSLQTQKLYTRAMELAGLTGSEHVIDAYCGVGAIGIIAARQAAHVTGIEFNGDAVKDAKINARLNGLDNIDFIAGDAGQVMQKMTRSADVVFVDPPRSGCDPAFLRSLAAHGPKRIVYISCYPETQARDVGYWKEHGYLLQTVQPVDMFPYTAHVETICLLSRPPAGRRFQVRLVDTEKKAGRT